MPGDSILAPVIPGTGGNEDAGAGLLAAVGGYLAGLFGGMLLVELFSTNTHDKSMEAAMTGAFVVGPLMAVLSVVVLLVVRARRNH